MEDLGSLCLSSLEDRIRRIVLNAAVDIRLTQMGNFVIGKIWRNDCTWHNYFSSYSHRVTFTMVRSNYSLNAGALVGVGEL